MEYVKSGILTKDSVLHVICVVSNRHCVMASRIFERGKQIFGEFNIELPVVQ